MSLFPNNSYQEDRNFQQWMDNLNRAGDLVKVGDQIEFRNRKYKLLQGTILEKLKVGSVTVKDQHGHTWKLSCYDHIENLNSQSFLHLLYPQST